MNRPLVLTLSILTFGAAAWSAARAEPAQTDESAEPLRAYTLSLDGQQFELQPGKPIQIEGKFEDPEAELKLGDTRHFAYGGLTFDYPAHYVWEADLEDPMVKIWTMDGADVTLFVLRSEFEWAAQEYAEVVADSLESEGEIVPLTRTYGGQTLRGVQLRARAAGFALTYEVLNIPVAHGGLLLVAMDSGDDAAPSAEFQELTNLLADTLAPEAVARLKARKAELEKEIAVWEVTYGDDHEFLQELREKLARVESELRNLQQ